MRFRIRATRVIQISVLLLLVICSAQVLWWIVDQAGRTEALRSRLTVLYTEDARAAEELLRLGADEARLRKLFPHLDLDTRGKIVVSPEALESLRLQRVRWLNQYGWEGTFFLVVLGVSMVAVWRALRQDRVLRRRQQNFIATVSHEFKSPLASLRLSAETMSLRELSRDRILKLTDRMTADVERMEDMVSKILDTSQLEQGRITLYPEPIGLATAVERVVEELENHVTSAGASIHIDIPPDLEIHADPVGVRTVLRNLLDNALKAVVVKGKGNVWVRAAQDQQFVHLRLEDDGIGFHRKDSRHLFEKFYHPGSELRRAHPGQGLGLYIVRRFIELEKGRVSADSRGVGKGAVFEVWWPLAAEGKT